MRVRHGLAGSAGLWSVIFFAFTVGAQSLSAAMGGWQFSRAAYDSGAWWQLLTSQWVHFGFAHAAVNAAGMVVLLYSFQYLVQGRLQWVALSGGYSAVAMVIALDPACSDYAGASGALHGLLAGNALALLMVAVPGQPERHAKSRALAVAVLLGLSVKLLVQHLGGRPGEPSWLGLATYYPAHEAGAFGGLLAVLLARLVAGHWFSYPGSRNQ